MLSETNYMFCRRLLRIGFVALTFCPISRIMRKIIGHDAGVSCTQRKVPDISTLCANVTNLHLDLNNQFKILIYNIIVISLPFKITRKRFRFSSNYVNDANIQY